MNYRVAHVSKTGDSINFPDNDEFPHLIEYISNDDKGEELFIVNENTGDYWLADEFFMMVTIKRFVVPATSNKKRSITRCKNKGVAKPVFFDGGTLSCGNASSIKEARDIAWEKLPDDIKKQTTKESLKPIEFDTAWLV